MTFEIYHTVFSLIYASEKKLKKSISFQSFYGHSLVLGKTTVYARLSEKEKE
jgi:hypothetical protein